MNVQFPILKEFSLDLCVFLNFLILEDFSHLTYVFLNFLILEDFSHLTYVILNFLILEDFLTWPMCLFTSSVFESLIGLSKSGNPYRKHIKTTYTPNLHMKRASTHLKTPSQSETYFGHQGQKTYFLKHAFFRNRKIKGTSISGNFFFSKNTGR